jgi:hypothetical protein
VIVHELPKLFAEFAEKRFALLWRGTRDGFSAKEFESRCDGHGDTLTLIEDTGGNIFGGFTPLKWESPKKTKTDPSLKSFIFTLKNPHDFPPKKFALKAEGKHEAIVCGASRGPQFRDIAVSDNCNTNTSSWASNFGSWYANDTGQDWATFFTGSHFFKVTEIEVIEIIE